MPDLPISGLPSLTTPEPSDLFAVVNNSITKKTTLQAVGDAVFTQISSSIVSTGSFNSFTQSYYNTTGSFGVTSYYGSFYHTASMLNPVPGTVNTMSLSTTDLSNGVVISGSIKDKIKFLNQLNAFSKLYIQDTQQLELNINWPKLINFLKYMLKYFEDLKWLLTELPKDAIVINKNPYVIKKEFINRH